MDHSKERFSKKEEGAKGEVLDSVKGEDANLSEVKILEAQQRGEDQDEAVTDDDDGGGVPVAAID